MKWSPKTWFGRFTKAMKGFGYKQSQGDHTLFTKLSGKEGITVLLIYFDYTIVNRNDEKELGRLKYF